MELKKEPHVLQAYNLHVYAFTVSHYRYLVIPSTLFPLFRIPSLVLSFGGFIRG
jgi:hypothetical protein